MKILGFGLRTVMIGKNEMTYENDYFDIPEDVKLMDYKKHTPTWSSTR